jgi:CRISPR type III-B/RAMP module RAMP protein Cmr1
MKPIEFKVKFVTPLLIGGSEANILDEIGLTGKALRGCWRFWFRAIVGGVLDGVPAEQFPALVSVLEECIFGSTKKSTFRMLVEPVCMPTGKYPTLPHKPFDSSKQGYSPGSTFKVSIIPRGRMMSRDEKNKKDVLLSSIWLWANLGAIGNRARRGFGSPVICPETAPGEVFTGIKLPVLTQDAFKLRDDLKNHLLDGLKMVWKKTTNWLNSGTLLQHINNNCTDSIKNAFNTWKQSAADPAPDIEKNKKPAGSSKANYFILKSLDQISVSDTTYNSLYLDTDKKGGSKGAINAVHGTTKCHELGWAKPLKKGDPNRWASPVFIRFHKVLENQKEVFCPVMAWCEQEEIPASTPSCAKTFLQNIGFENSLKGNPI